MTTTGHVEPMNGLDTQFLVAKMLDSAADCYLDEYNQRSRILSRGEPIDSFVCDTGFYSGQQMARSFTKQLHGMGVQPKKLHGCVQSRWPQ